MTRLAKARLYERIREGRFPRPVKLGKRAVAWVESEVLDWMLERMNERPRH
jgi:prophage regulatory protein